MEGSRLMILLAGCAGIVVCILIVLSGPEPLETSVPHGKPLISVGKIERTVAANSVTAFGSLMPRQTLQLTTQVPGEITWVSDSLAAGGQVAEGDELFRIDERDYAIAVARAKASYEQAEANIDLEQGRSEVARLEWSSWQQTHGKEAKASPLALRAPQRAQALAALKVIHTELDRAHLALERTSVRAPWPATVVEANAIEGQVLSIGEVTATLFPLDFAMVEVQVPVNTLHLIDAGVERVELRPVYDMGITPTTGSLEGIVRNLTNDTRLATVRVRIDQPLAQGGWAYGMHVEANIVTGKHRAIAQIPAELIVGGNLVWIYREGKARRHQVHPIQSSGRTVSVEDNFVQGDALILERPIGLFDGADVDVAGE
ncbi:MAG: efflux RND transporter periplasmic adaptor subunit [Gammaproteobacteria bacterium]|jgi:RND family efflux transporter MFP subunit|nr:efflux RND transporter periplasmic adaptor subunit [Gammaproteobacteria bacterium]|tara:strand:- start:3263 stop:4381 length:1119 start_codon:yes stop_codon:yes gene_type:complete